MKSFYRSPMYVDPKRPRAWITAQELADKWDFTTEYVERERKMGVFYGLVRRDHHRQCWLYHSEAIEILMVNADQDSEDKFRCYLCYGENGENL